MVTPLLPIPRSAFGAQFRPDCPAIGKRRGPLRHAPLQGGVETGPRLCDERSRLVRARPRSISGSCTTAATLRSWSSLDQFWQPAFVFSYSFVFITYDELSSFDRFLNAPRSYMSSPRVALRRRIEGARTKKRSSLGS
ncbi:hypothetical protein GWI33_022287 [Rhynchophorus ferrugineus]|uniref:Uncharacterized protein n=1 Tax=Rhynchophorus ferrugineus TaxID=354439 RepID=A0A834IQV0_RHYFE|nr:hypothetical protein GWI33_022287 [Rhynchophorus ferrugineus]